MPFVQDANGLVYKPMSGEAMLALRRRLGVNRIAFGQLLGLTGENRNIYTTVMRYEEGRRDISPTVERVVLLLGWFLDDHGHLPDLDRGRKSPAQLEGA